MADARIDYVELPSATAHELTRAFYARLRLGVHRLRPDLFGDDQRNDRCRPAGRSRRCAFGAAAGHPGRRSRGGVRCRDQGRRRHRQADLQLPGRPALPVHRSVGQRARRLERDLARRSAPRDARRRGGDRVDARMARQDRLRHRRCGERLAIELQPAGVQPRGSRRSETAMSASAQALVNGAQSIGCGERVASSRHSAEPLRSSATQASLEQALNGRGRGPPDRRRSPRLRRPASGHNRRPDRAGHTACRRRRRRRDACRRRSPADRAPARRPPRTRRPRTGASPSHRSAPVPQA